MTITNIVLGSLIVAGPLVLVLAHQSGRLADWWITLHHQSNRPPRP